MNQLLASFQYISGFPYFWGSMGFTTAVAMFVGALIYNGNAKTLAKGFITIFSYMFLLLLVTGNRVFPQLTPENASTALGSFTTILVITPFYCLGLLLGVLMVRRKRDGF